MVLFSPLGDRVLAKPMKYASLARLTLSLVSCNWSSGSSCKSSIECMSGFTEVLCNPGCVGTSVYNVCRIFSTLLGTCS